MKCCTSKNAVPKLDKLVIVERLSSAATIDGSGNADETLNASWVQAGREWMKCVTKGSREFVVNDQLREDISHQWIMRWSQRAATYTTAMRLKWNDRYFNIAAPPINVDEENVLIRIETVETARV